MVRNDFSRIITTLCEYYERREPKNAALEAWFARCRHIPAEPLDYIAQKIMENHETFPKNLPAAMRDTFTEWLQANPDKRAGLRRWVDLHIETSGKIQREIQVCLFVRKMRAVLLPAIPEGNAGRIDCSRSHVPEVERKKIIPRQRQCN